MEVIIFISLLAAITSTGTAMSNNCNALVVYNDKAPLSRFNQKEQSLEIGGRKVVLVQDWDGNGVAGVLWDSAIILSDYIVQHELVRGKRVLELGAGIGLPSIVAARDGATSVTVTDQEMALRLLNDNMRLNLTPDELSRTSISALEWSTEEQSGHAHYDVILGADLVYKKEVFDALRMTLHSLSSENTIILMASKIRYPKDRKFYTTLSKQFDVTQIHYDPTMDVTLYRIVKQK